MTRPRLLSREELELVRDTQGAVLNGADGGPEIWTADVVHTALVLDAQAAAHKDEADSYHQKLCLEIERTRELKRQAAAHSASVLEIQVRMLKLEEALRERAATACSKACGFRQTIEDGRLKRIVLHSPECESAMALMASPPETP